MADVLTASAWEEELVVGSSPSSSLGRGAQRGWASLNLEGLFRPADRKSVTRLAEVVAPGQSQQLRHFISTSPWKGYLLEELFVHRADRLVGGPDAVLIIDDTALVKHAFCPISWRDGTKGTLSRDFAALRVRVAGGARTARGQFFRVRRRRSSANDARVVSTSTSVQSSAPDVARHPGPCH